MIIKEITIENFRSYYGVNTIKFNDGLMIFIGDNGDGKTTFFEALEWLFDTSRPNLDSHLISEKKIAELTEFETDTLRVSMIFDHDGEKIVEKSFAFSKNKEGEIRMNDFQFKGYQNEGSERTQISGDKLLDRCFEPHIRKYSLLKGEENLNVFNNPDALNFLIEKFSNITQFDPFYNEKEDKSSFTDYAEDQSRKAFEKVMRSDKQNTRQEKELSYERDELRRKLSEVRQRLRNNRHNATNYTSKLDEIENSKESSENLKKINERLKSLKEKRSKMESHINEDYSIKLLDDMWILCGFPIIFEEFQQKISNFSKSKRKLEREEDKLKGKQELAQEIAEGFIPLSPNIPDKISMQEMIDEKICKVCGRLAEEGSDAYNFMVNKFKDLVRSQQSVEKEDKKSLFPNNFLRELEQKSNNLEYGIADVNDLINRIRGEIEFNDARKNDLSRIQESIVEEEDKKSQLLANNNDLTEDQLQNAYENIRNWYDYKIDAEKQIVALEIEEVQLESELEKVQEQYDNLAKGSLADIHRKIYNAFDKIKIAFKNAKDKNTRDFLLQLENKANEYLERLNYEGFFGIIRIINVADGTARIALQDQNNRLISNPNQALKTTMYMSVLFAVSDLTSLKRENDYPLIFDAPTSSFSPQKENDFFKIISEINKQCIIFTKSFLTENGDLDKSKIDAQNCTIYRMEKQRPFNNLDLSTIQTKITLIKE